MIVAVTRTAPARLPSALRYRLKPQVLISDVVTQLTATPLARRVAVKLAKLIASGPGLITVVVGSPSAGVLGSSVSTGGNPVLLTVPWLKMISRVSGLLIVTWKLIDILAPAGMTPISM